jgi:peptidoglycan hydrolase-like protein with peptidoglycan-binding domain
VAGSDLASKLYGKVPASWWKPGYGGWGTATILQFSSKGKVAGRQVDVNAFRGTVEQLRVLTRTPPRPAPPTPKPPSGNSPTRRIVMELPQLRRGATGTQVRVLQALLNVRGQRVSEDGQFGPSTEAAVRNEQREARLDADGIAGPRTYSVLLLGKNIV